MTPAPTPEQAVAAAQKFNKFEVLTDGTAKGTTIKINGKTIENLSSLSFYWYGGSYCPLSLSYTTRESAAKPGEMSTCTTYHLRCPEPTVAYATRADAAVGGIDPGELVWEMAQADHDPLIAAREAAEAKATRRHWAQL